MLFIGEHYVSGKEDVRNVLAQLLGIDQYDVDDIVREYDKEEMQDMEESNNILRDENASYEASLDSYHACMCEVMDIVDEYLAKQRVNGRDALKAIKSVINQHF